MYEMSFNTAELIPYENFKEKLKIIDEELKKDRYIEVWEGYIYSAIKYKNLEKVSV